jgi:3-keto-disaccharide hydrolase
MTRFSLALMLCAAPALCHAASPFAGRWDLTVTPNTGRAYPDWMELVEEGGKPSMRIQPRSGGARQIPDFQLAGSKLHVVFSKADAKNPEVVWDLEAAGDGINGTITRGGAKSAAIAGVRAPKLDRKPPARWSAAEPLFNGKDLSGWEPMTPNNNHWTMDHGELLNTAGGANLKSTRSFEDFRLHFEVFCPDEANSGVYLRGRYELQLEYQAVDANDPLHSMGSIYSFVGPKTMLPRKPGTWETFDVTLVGRRITVVRNGVKTIDDQEIPGPTGGALDANEAEPGPFYIQGDHTGGLRFRNFTVQVPAR